MAIKFEGPEEPKKKAPAVKKSNPKSKNQTRGGKRPGAGRKRKVVPPVTPIEKITGSAAARDPETGRFLPGNRFWEARTSHGRDRIFSDPETLWEACVEYFEWCEANPLHEAGLVTFQGCASIAPIPKMRAFTLVGLCMFIGIDRTTWAEWKKTRPDFSHVITRAEETIYQQKFEGASAGLLVANIIARDLGLADKRDLSGSVTVKDERSPDEIREAIEGKLAGIATRDGETKVPPKPDA